MQGHATLYTTHTLPNVRSRYFQSKAVCTTITLPTIHLCRPVAWVQYQTALLLDSDSNEDGVKLWNYLSNNLRDCNSVTIFKKNLKKYLISFC